MLITPPSPPPISGRQLKTRQTGEKSKVLGFEGNACLSIKLGNSRTEGCTLTNLEEKSLRCIAMVAKFMDDNKLIKSLKSLFALFQTSPILSSFI